MSLWVRTQKDGFNLPEEKAQVASRQLLCLTLKPSYISYKVLSSTLAGSDWYNKEKQPRRGTALEVTLALLKDVKKIEWF